MATSTAEVAVVPHPATTMRGWGEEKDDISPVLCRSVPSSLQSGDWKKGEAD